MLLLVISPTCLPNDIDGKSANAFLAHWGNVDQQIKPWLGGLDVLGLSYINPIIEWLGWLWVAQAQVMADRQQQAIDLNTATCQKELIASFRVSLPRFQGLSRSPLPLSPSVQISCFFSTLFTAYFYLFIFYIATWEPLGSWAWDLSLGYCLCGFLWVLQFRLTFQWHGLALQYCWLLVIKLLFFFDLGKHLVCLIYYLTWVICYTVCYKQVHCLNSLKRICYSHFIEI